MKVIISPYSSKIQDDEDAKCKVNPKNYPYWNELVRKLIRSGAHITQIGVAGENTIGGVHKVLFDSPMSHLKDLLDECNFWISVDNFFHHFAHYHNKKGVVLWGQSNPIIFGYPENINILKSKEYLRPEKEQWLWWKWAEYKREAFSSPSTVMNVIESYKHLWN